MSSKETKKCNMFMLVKDEIVMSLLLLVLSTVSFHSRETLTVN